MTTASSPRRALLSCTDKTGLAGFAAGLVELGFELISTGGTRQALEQAGLRVTDVAAVTGFPEMMDGRLKTLHPKVHGGLLGRPGLPGDAASMAEYGILPFELVVVNLYAFVETISKPGTTPDQAIEQIDIGGPSMLRSAAKNHAYVTVVTDPADYGRVLEVLQTGPIPFEMRRQFAAKVFEITAQYDRAIADYLQTVVSANADGAVTDGPVTDGKVTPDAFPQRLSIGLKKWSSLRYGENPHQLAAAYSETTPPPGSLVQAEYLHGKELSYNNLLDLDAALQIVREFGEPAAVVIKHNNPCGCATAASLKGAYLGADAGDPVSAFGGILGFNRVVDVETALELADPKHFTEAIIAPGFAPEALEILTTKPKWKNSVRLLQLAGMSAAPAPSFDYRRITGGILVQERDDQIANEANWKVVTQRHPTAAEQRDLSFAWRVCRYVKSNAILLAKGEAVIGVGAGQMSRLDSAWIAATKAGERSHGSVAASDAFFPFRDGVDQLHAAGIRAIIQPGGSKRDDETIAACNEHGIAMMFTGRRHFRH